MKWPWPCSSTTGRSTRRRRSGQPSAPCSETRAAGGRYSSTFVTGPGSCSNVAPGSSPSPTSPSRNTWRPAVHEGNRLGIDPETLAREHHDGRWKEVIALYCGLAPAPAARAMLERLIAQDDSLEIAAVLAEAYFTSGPEIHQDRDLRTRIVERLARAPLERRRWIAFLSRRSPRSRTPPSGPSGPTSRPVRLLSGCGDPEYLDRARLRERIFHRTTESPVQLSELICLAFMSLDIEDLARLADDAALLSSHGQYLRGRCTLFVAGVYGYLRSRSTVETAAISSDRSHSLPRPGQVRLWPPDGLGDFPRRSGLEGQVRRK